VEHFNGTLELVKWQKTMPVIIENEALEIN